MKYYQRVEIWRKSASSEGRRVVKLYQDTGFIKLALAFGVKPAAAYNRTWPKDLAFVKECDGFTFALMASNGGQHRFFVCCPDCKVRIPWGRIHQHAGSGVCRAQVEKNVDVTR